MAGLEARLQDAQDSVARDHPNDVILGDDRHLIDVLGLHALEDGQGGLVGSSGVDLIDGQHHGLNGCVGALVARN